MKGESKLEKESLQQIQILESVLKDGILLANCNEIKMGELAGLYEKDLPDFNLLSPYEYFKQVLALFFTATSVLLKVEYREKALTLIKLVAKSGFLKKQCCEKLEMCGVQELLYNESNEIKRLVQISKEIPKVVQKMVEEFNDIEISPLISSMEGICWNSVLSLDNINLCNEEIKHCIRDKYHNMTSDYINSILSRKISLNSKRLAIMNYMKQIQDKCVDFVPYEIEYATHSNDYLGRKCDKEYQHNRIINKKRN